MWENIEGQKTSKIKGFHTYIYPVVSHVETVVLMTRTGSQNG